MPGLLKSGFVLQHISRGDLLILVLAFAFVLSFYVIFWRVSDSAGQFVHIINGHNEIQKVSLFQNQDIDIKGNMGNSRIQVQGGRVRFVDSPCSNKLCIHQGWTRFSDEIIACLPNRVSVSIIGQQSRFDTINF